MKIGVFSDVYYSETDLNIKKDGLTSAQKLKKVMTAFAKAKVDLCFCMGNLVKQQGVDRAQVLKNFESAMQMIRLYSIPCYYVPAPEDFVQTSPKDLMRLAELYRLEYAIHAGDWLFIVLDGNYTTELLHCEKESAWQPQYRLPPEQIRFLKEKSGMCRKHVILTYHNIDTASPSRFCLQNADEVRQTLLSMKSAHLVIQGASPYESDETVDGIRYLNVPSMRDSAAEVYRIIEL